MYAKKISIITGILKHLHEDNPLSFKIQVDVGNRNPDELCPPLILVIERIPFIEKILVSLFGS